MSMNEALRLVAGAVILLTTLLAVLVSQYFLLISAIVGLSLFQSAFTKWCPMMVVLGLLGFKNESA